MLNNPVQWELDQQCPQLLTHLCCRVLGLNVTEHVITHIGLLIWTPQKTVLPLNNNNCDHFHTAISHWQGMGGGGGANHALWAQQEHTHYNLKNRKLSGHITTSKIENFQDTLKPQK